VPVHSHIAVDAHLTSVTGILHGLNSELSLEEDDTPRLTRSTSSMCQVSSQFLNYLENNPSKNQSPKIQHK
jgi:hypothetical protein